MNEPHKKQQMVFVTGATGILGRVMVLELLKRGKKVRAAKRASSRLDEVRHSYGFYTEDPEGFFGKIEWADVDFDDLASLQEALEEVTEVYHCAAKVGFNPKDSKAIHHMNVKGTQNLLFACEGSSVEKFLFVSSIAVLDLPNEDGELDETSDFNPKEDHSAYALSKHLAEMEVWRASAEGLNTVIVNPGMIIGSGSWGNSSGDIFPTIEKNRFSFPGGSSYVDVRDVARLSIELMERNIFGERFILVAESRSYAALGRQIRTKLGLPEAKVLPEPVLKLGMVANILFGWLVPMLRMATRLNIKAVSTMNAISSRKIKETLGCRFIPLEETVDFHLNHYINDKKPKK